MMPAESCVIEQYTVRILRTVEPTNSLERQIDRISDEPKCEMVGDVNLLDDARSCAGVALSSRPCGRVGTLRHKGLSEV